MNQPVIQALADTFTQISGIMLSPIPLAGLIVALTSNEGRKKSVVFGAGYFCSLWLATFVVALLAHKIQDHVSRNGDSSGWHAIALGLLGVILLIFSIINFIKWSKNRSDTTEPKWMGQMDSASLFTVFITAVILVLVNPKNLPLVISAGIEYAQANLSIAQLSLVITIFSFLGSLLALLIIGFEFIAPKVADNYLEKLRPRLIADNKLILAVIFFIMGFHLLEKGLVEAENVITEFPAVTGSEDCHMLVQGIEGVKIAYIPVGVAPPDVYSRAIDEGEELPYSNHQPDFMVDLNAIPFGSKVATLIALTPLLRNID